LDWSIQKIKSYLKKSFGLGIVCLDKDSIIGFVLVEKNYSSQKPNVAWLTYIMIDKKHRHNNIASDMITLAISHLKSANKTDLITDVYMDNTASIDFFKKNNFKIKEKWVIMSRKI
jgi:ribosomal protein S18 acetylase RimI-like enzyme